MKVGDYKQDGEDVYVWNGREFVLVAHHSTPFLITIGALGLTPGEIRAQAEKHKPGDAEGFMREQLEIAGLAPKRVMESVVIHGEVPRHPLS